jgi:NAD(P)-dependent dehydrogenase (short-subunit alcohol dehydrogenase family)
LQDLFSLAGRIGVVTGAGQGNGAAIAMGMAAAGASVAVIDRDLKTASQTASRISDAGGHARAYQADVSEVENCAVAAAKIREDFGPVSILVNNAGILRRLTLEDEGSRDAWKATFAVNVDGTFNMTDVFKPALKETKGTIINIVSIQSFIANANSAAYSASKGAVAQFTKALAVELAPFGVRVNAIAPGLIETPMTAVTQANPEKLAVHFQHTPMKRAGKPEELAGVAIFLASRASSYMTGAILPVDRGYLTV